VIDELLVKAVEKAFSQDAGREGLSRE